MTSAPATIRGSAYSRGLNLLNALHNSREGEMMSDEEAADRWRPGQPWGGPVEGLLPEDVEEADDPENHRRSHFYSVPNIIYDLGLSSPARDLYGYYCRRAGAGLRRRVTEGSATTGKRLRLHKQTILNARRELAERELIRVRKTRIHGGVGFEVTVLNLWRFVRAINAR